MDKQLANVPEPVKNLYAHLSAGKDLSEFQFAEGPTSWEDADVSDEDIARAALKQYLAGQGLSAEDIEDEIDDAIIADRLEKKASIAKKALVKKEKTDKQAEVNAREARQKEDERIRAQEIDDIKLKIKESDSFAGFKLNSAKKKEFEDHLFKRNKKTGKTQLESNMADQDRLLTIGFLDFMEYSKSDLEKEVKTELTKKRRKTLTKYTTKMPGNSNSSVAVQKKAGKNQGVIKFPSIFGGSTIETED